MDNLINLANKVRFILEDEHGNVKQEVECFNKTCDAGRASIGKRIGGYADDPYIGQARYIAIGTGTGTVATTDVALFSEQYRAEVQTGLANFTGGTTIKIYARFNIGYAIAVTEAGIFLDGTATLTNGSGAMLAHTLPPSTINKLSTDALTIERTINILNSTP